MRRRAAYVIVGSSYVGAAINAVSGFVFVPWYLHDFGLATYGAWLASGNILALLSLLDGGVNQVASQRLAESYGSGDIVSFARLAGAVLTLGVLTFFVLILAVAAGATMIVSHLSFDGVDMRMLALATFLAGVGAALAFLQANLYSFMLAWQRPLVTSIGLIGGQAAALVAIAVGLFAGLGVASLGLGALVRGVVGCAVTLTALIRDWRMLGLPAPAFVKADTVALIKSSVPLTGARVISGALNHSESALVAMLLGAEAAGVLGLTMRLYQFAGMLVNPIAGASASGLAHLFGSGDHGRLTQVMRELFATSAAVSALFFVPVLAINERLMGVWVGHDRYAGWLADCAICASMVLLVRSNLLQIALVAMRDYALAFACNASELVIRCVFVFVLTPVFGIAAVPMATVASSLGTVVIVLVMRGRSAERASPVRWPPLVVRGLTTVLCTALVVVIFRLVAARLSVATADWLHLMMFAAALGCAAFVTVVATSSVVRDRIAVRFAS